MINGGSYFSGTITVDTALILAKVFGSSPDFLLNLQKRNDILGKLGTLPSFICHCEARSNVAVQRAEQRDVVALVLLQELMIKSVLFILRYNKPDIDSRNQKGTFTHMIKSFKHKGLENFFYSGTKKGITPEHAGTNWKES